MHSHLTFLNNFYFLGFPPGALKYMVQVFQQIQIQCCQLLWLAFMTTVLRLGQFRTITPGFEVTGILAKASEADGSNTMWMNQITLQVKKEK